MKILIGGQSCPYNRGLNLESNYVYIYNLCSHVPTKSRLRIFTAGPWIFRSCVGSVIQYYVLNAILFASLSKSNKYVYERTFSIPCIFVAVIIKFY